MLYLIAMMQFDSCVWNESMKQPMQFVYCIIGCLGMLSLFKGCLNLHSAILENAALEPLR